MKYLIDVTETYRVDSEKEAVALIDEAKKQSEYTLIKYTSIQKEKKEKGEIVETWYKVSLVKRFTEEKDPYCSYNVSYTEASAMSRKENADEDEDIK